jgi:hypothetical protein
LFRIERFDGVPVGPVVLFGERPVERRLTISLRDSSLRTSALGLFRRLYAIGLVGVFMVVTSFPDDIFLRCSNYIAVPWDFSSTLSAVSFGLPCRQSRVHNMSGPVEEITLVGEWGDPTSDPFMEGDPTKKYGYYIT